MFVLNFLALKRIGLQDELFGTVDFVDFVLQDIPVVGDFDCDDVEVPEHEFGQLGEVLGVEEFHHYEVELFFLVVAQHLALQHFSCLLLRVDVIRQIRVRVLIRWEFKVQLVRQHRLLLVLLVDLELVQFRRLVIVVLNVLKHVFLGLHLQVSF